MIALTFWTGLILGIVIGGTLSALSSKFLGWFNKQTQVVKTDIAVLTKK